MEVDGRQIVFVPGTGIFDIGKGLSAALGKLGPDTEKTFSIKMAFQGS